MNVKITECPRDAIQGMSNFIPTFKKIEFYNLLLQVGFDVIDIGSFVSHKIMPQMRDTGKIIDSVNMERVLSKLLVIVANYRGASDAVLYEKISYLGYPFSVSEIFQQKNTNKSILESLKDVNDIYDLCQKKNKKLIIYLSMAFGNPYDEDYNLDIINKWVLELSKIGINIIMLSDTVGVANNNSISKLFRYLIYEFPKIEFGAHLHSDKLSCEDKINTAINSGCRYFDTVIKGYGGCPMAQDNLIGNIDTETLITFLCNKKIKNNINFNKFKEVVVKAMNFYR